MYLYLSFKFRIEFHQTEQPTASIGWLSPTLCCDKDVTLELWSHKSEQIFLRNIRV